ncbi:alpha-xylosidase [Celerinatantimonas sp. MCCC 1A17872]|uniref:alpha-xylosidase n=1 Tax=Celerinatantimonas sp. MCCC 1A17872 TaxID=3177514 RepID=UPI0038C422A9
MKISDGNWLLQPNLQLIPFLYVFDVQKTDNSLVAYVAPKDTSFRTNQLDTSLFTIEIASPQAGIIRVSMVHFDGDTEQFPNFKLNTDEHFVADCTIDNEFAYLTSGELSVKLPTKGLWDIQFFHQQLKLTGSSAKNSGYLIDQNTNQPYMFSRLDLGVGETVYGLGERFSALVKNGQVVDTWNRDGGTSTEQAYKNIPFYLTNRGYGVFVNEPQSVSFEVASEKVSKMQFSTEGERLEFYLIDGPMPKEVLNRYTRLTGRPALPPAWTFGLWLTTSFTTNYDEQTVNQFIDGMAERQLPLHVFHFDCFWMKPFQWCDFQWDPDTFPDPKAMLARLHDKGLHLCVWINPYIGQKSPLFAQGKANGYLLKRPDGSIWQWDKWQAGQAIVDFTNPQAVNWYQDHLRRLVDMGVDCFKTDFGERIPTDVQWHNQANPKRMHNYYALLYNQLVYEVLEEKLGKGQAAVFARSATVGSQQYPVHWGGDSYATYESMAESLRGGLSLGLSGFGYWSHDIGGFEETAPAHVYKRWCAFGLFSSHSRLHGSSSYRVPWNFDEQACDVLRYFTQWKCRLMPYLYAMAVNAQQTGTPMMRAMLLDFPLDPACEYLDQQYMFGDSLLVAPVFNERGDVRFYLPHGKWTQLFNNKQLSGGHWQQQNHDVLSMPVYVKPNTLLALGNNDQRPDYNYADGTQFSLFELEEQHQASSVIYDLEGHEVFRLTAYRRGSEITFESAGISQNCSICLRNIFTLSHASYLTVEDSSEGLILSALPEGEFTIKL